GLRGGTRVVALQKTALRPLPPLAWSDDPILRVFRVRCAPGAGIEELKRGLFELCPPAEPQTTADDEGLVEFLVYRPRPSGRRFRVLRTDRGFRIAGEVPDETTLADALKAAGAREGDEVEVDGETLEFS